MFILLSGMLMGAVLLSPAGLGADAARATPAKAALQDQDVPKILLDAAPRAVEYQLARLTNDQLSRVERKDTEAKYRPVYVAVLTRSGMARPFREEAVAALAKMDRSSPTRVLLDALAKIPTDDTPNAASLLGLLLAQPADVLRQQRETLAQAAAPAAAPPVVRGAYGGLMIADGDFAPAWQSARKVDGHLVELLRSVPHLGGADALRAKLFTPVAALLAETQDAATRAAAVEALAHTRRDAATFDVLAREILRAANPESRAAAIASLPLIPENVWTSASIEPLANAIVAFVKETPAERRTEPTAIDAIHLGEKLAATLPADRRLAARRELRALGVQVVQIQSVPEQMVFDLNWFVVQAGKPVQIVLGNPDAMPHNLVIGQPGSVAEIGTKAAAMPMPTDPEVKPFVPDTPLVLYATRLLNGGETDRLNFSAPAKPGEYVFVCTFPGHWVRMYGVMLVVENLEAWEAKPTVPTDPMTKKPFASQRAGVESK